jgi:hypothetical protein
MWEAIIVKAAAQDRVNPLKFFQFYGETKCQGIVKNTTTGLPELVDLTDEAFQGTSFVAIMKLLNCYQHLSKEDQKPQKWTRVALRRFIKEVRSNRERKAKLGGRREELAAYIYI